MDRLGPPAIGITTRQMDAGAQRLDVVDRAYGLAVTGSGGTPLLFTRPASNDNLDALNLVDALLLTGGGDVDPALYGEDRAAPVGGVDSGRDAWEIGLVWRAIAKSIPILGICRGSQVLNVACGGTLIQDLPAVTSQPHLVPDSRDRIVHTIRIETASQLSEISPESQIGVNSVHHQAVDSLGEDLRAVAWAKDGVVEAIEHSSRPILGVQWHPENLVHHPSHLALFSWLTRHAARRRRETGTPRAGMYV